MDRTVLEHVGVATVSLLFAALVVAAGSYLALPAFVYPALVLVGALVSGGIAHAVGVEWTVAFALLPPWTLALILGPTPALAGGLLAGAVGGLLSVPVVLKVGETTDALAN